MEEDRIDELFQIPDEDLELLSKIVEIYQMEELLRLEIDILAGKYISEGESASYEPHEYLRSETVPPEIEDKVNELDNLEERMVDYLEESKDSENLRKLDYVQDFYDRYCIDED